MSENINNEQELNEEFFKNYSGAIDLPDERDYTIEEVLGEEWAASTELPKKVVLDMTPILNQGHIGACTLFGSSNAYFETYAQAISPQTYTQPYDVWAAWDEAKKKGASDIHGWGYQPALQHLVDTKRTGNYVLLRVPGNKRPEMIDRMKTALAQGRAIIAGSSHTDWGYVMNTGRYREQEKFSGHIYAFTAYDDELKFSNGDVGGFWSPNNWGGLGGFWISYKQFLNARMYTNYTWLLTEEHQKFADAKNKRRNAYLQKAHDAKIWNEERPADTASALEIRVMLNRALAHIDRNIAEDWRGFRSSYAYLFEEKIARGKIALYNETRKWELASDEELALMFTRAVTRNVGLNELVLTREQVAEVVGRDFL